MGQTHSTEPRGSGAAGAGQESERRLVPEGQSSVEFRSPSRAVAEPAPENSVVAAVDEEDRSSTSASETLVVSPPPARKSFDGTEYEDDGDITAYAGMASNGARPSDEIEFAAKQGMRTQVQITC